MESKVKKMKQKKKLESGSSKKADEKKRLFLDNRGIFLEKLIADCNGKSIPIRNFFSSQIFKATNNFDSSCLVESLQGHHQWYKGIIKDKPYLIKKFSKYEDKEDVFNDIVLSARMSNHSNFLKLLGCCFEFLLPVVVFEYAELAALSVEEHIMFNGEESILSWSVRLKIAKEIAIAVTYLHTAFPRIIIHKNIMPTNIFLDKNWKVKLTDFRFSVSLPEGKSRMEDERFSDIITGTFGYIDPVYLSTRSLSEYTDVYNFGVCLMVFLTGRSPHNFFEEPKSDGVPRNIVENMKYSRENDKIDEVIDPMIAKDITSGQRLQVEAYAVLALRCCEKREEDRPKMIQVAKELKRIERMNDSSFPYEFPKLEMLDVGRWGQVWSSG